MNELQTPHIRLLACECANLHAHPTQWNYLNVSAPYWRLYWNDKPGAAIRRKGQCVRLSPARIVLVPPNTVFSSSNRSHVRQVYIHFQILAPYQASVPDIISIPVSKHLKTVLHEIIRLRRTPAQGHRQLALTAYALAALSLSRIAEQAIDTPDVDVRVLKSLSHIENNLGSVLTNHELAQSAGMSTNAFITFFKSQMGLCPHAYVRVKRIDKACLLLHFSLASIKQIAEETGFCDRYHFSRVFKRLQGIGPAEFRRLNQNPFLSPAGQP